MGVGAYKLTHSIRVSNSKGRNPLGELVGNPGLVGNPDLSRHAGWQLAAQVECRKPAGLQ